MDGHCEQLFTQIYKFCRFLIENCIVSNYFSEQNLTDISITKFIQVRVTFIRWSKFLNRHCVHIFEDLLYYLSSVDVEFPPSRFWTATVEIMNSDFRRVWGSTNRSVPIHRPVHLSGRAPP